mmetsp:Transcript_37974/g.69195  ORF Transcript_37974/g.69195 Transcript_37974/m.69195 type:complete len:200 (+) Transcript_37974:3-602(+)
MTSEVAVWLTCDGNFRIIRCTPKFTELIAFTPTYFMTKFLDFVAARDKPVVLQCFHEAAEEYYSASAEDHTPLDTRPARETTLIKFRMWPRTGTCLAVQAKVLVSDMPEGATPPADCKGEAEIDEFIFLRVVKWHEKGKRVMKNRSNNSLSVQKDPLSPEVLSPRTRSLYDSVVPPPPHDTSSTVTAAFNLAHPGLLRL